MGIGEPSESREEALDEDVRKGTLDGFLNDVKPEWKPGRFVGASPGEAGVGWREVKICLTNRGQSLTGWREPVTVEESKCLVCQGVKSLKWEILR